MADESQNQQIRIAPPAERAVHRDHYCEHPGCQEWGSFGFGRPQSDEQPRWYCYAHRGDGEN